MISASFCGTPRPRSDPTLSSGSSSRPRATHLYAHRYKVTGKLILRGYNKTAFLADIVLTKFKMAVARMVNLVNYTQIEVIEVRENKVPHHQLRRRSLHSNADRDKVHFCNTELEITFTIETGSDKCAKDARTAAKTLFEKLVAVSKHPQRFERMLKDVGLAKARSGSLKLEDVEAQDGDGKKQQFTPVNPIDDKDESKQQPPKDNGEEAAARRAPKLDGLIFLLAMAGIGLLVILGIVVKLFRGGGTTAPEPEQSKELDGVGINPAED